MSFDYDKIREKQEDANWWASYADLWSMLSIVFLVMYVSASLRSGTQGIQSQIELQVVEKKNEELKEQLRVYNALRDESLSNSNKEEQEVYKQLMDKLSLLSEEAKGEKENLRKQAEENEKKEFALNHYQQVIRNIIDTNVLAKASIKRRDKIVSAQNQSIEEKKKLIQNLNVEIKSKEKAIAKNEQEVLQIQTRLSEQISKLKEEEQKAKISKASAAAMVKRLQEQSARKIESLKRESEQTRIAMNDEIEKTKQEHSEEIENVERKLASVQKDKDRATASLKNAQELLAIKANLVKDIKRNFAKQGVKAQIDKNSGDVTLDFGEEYFDTGSAKLKPGMVKSLKKLFPAYSKSLFEDPKTANKIATIEIIGFASSTFKGRYVNPSSLKPENQEAINYNLKLSFDRANSIFKHIFDPKKMTYEHQKKLLGMVKVVGRGFLPTGAQAHELPDDMPEKEFCQKFNCEKAQRVIVKFNLKE